MNTYFDTVKKSKWSFGNAFKHFTQENEGLGLEQRVSLFREELKKQKDPIPQKWSTNWKDLCKSINKESTSKADTPGVSVDMRGSKNKMVNIAGNVNNYSNKRERESRSEAPANKRQNRDGQYEQEEDSSDPHSDLTDDYHPGRTVEYDLLEENQNLPPIPESSPMSDRWITQGYDITQQLENFRNNSFNVPPKKLSDLRLLALNHIYLFALTENESITNYLDVYDEDDDEYGVKAEMVLSAIKSELCLNDGAVDISENIVDWTNKLSKESIANTDWFDIQGTTISFLNQAYEHGSRDEITAANILHRLTLNFCNRSPNLDLEDSFAHIVVSSVFESVFQSDPLLSYQWANGFLNGSSKYKPDFIVFVTHSQVQYDLAISELKSPSSKSSNNTTESDLVKIGKELACMLNALIRNGVDNPAVCGILLKGYKMRLFKMDLKYSQTYRMIELSSINVFDNLQGVVSLPSILRNIFQVKNIVKKTAVKAKKRALARSNDQSPVYSPPLSYMASSSYNLRRVSQKVDNKK